MSQCDGFSSREKAKMQLSAETKLGLTVTGNVLNPYSHHKLLRMHTILSLLLSLLFSPFLC